MPEKSSFRLNGFLVAGFCLTALSPALVYFGKEGTAVGVVISGFILSGLSAYFIYHGREIATKKQNEKFKSSMEEKINRAIGVSESAHEVAALNELKQDLVKEFRLFDEGGGRAALRTKIEEQEQLWNSFFKLAYNTLFDYLRVVQTERPELHIELNFPPLPHSMTRQDWTGSVIFGKARTWNIALYNSGGSPHIKIEEDGTARSFEMSLSKNEMLHVSNYGLLILPDIEGVYGKNETFKIMPQLLKKLIEVQLLECKG